MRGRPTKWNTPEELENQINLYFEQCKEENEIPTVSGLAYHLGTNRQTLINYENNQSGDWLKRFDDDFRGEYANIIKMAKSYIESRYEQALFNRSMTTGAIFALKNGFKDWKDKQEVVQTAGKSIDLSELTTEEIQELLKG